jgi:hypothetical protein
MQTKVKNALAIRREAAAFAPLKETGKKCKLQLGLRGSVDSLSIQLLHEIKPC